MHTPSKTLVDLEKKFWSSLVAHDTDAAVDLLLEPALLVGSHGAKIFDHAGYRKMAEESPRVVKSFELSHMETVFPNDTTAILTYHVKQKLAAKEGGQSTAEEMHDTSTWIRMADGWKCAMHTETPMDSSTMKH